MSGNTISDVLGPVDSAFYYVDRPETPMNIGSLMIFDGKIDYDQLLKLIDSRMHHAPLYRKRIVQAPLRMGQPRWVFDPEFYIENHVFKVTLDPPGTEEQLRKLAGHIVSGMLDRSKPLWEIHMIEGLENNRTGMVFKVHHCMVDGLSAVEIFSLLFDFTPEVKPIPRKPLYDPPYLPGKTQMVVDAIKQELPHKWKILKKISGDISYMASVFQDKETRRRALVGIANLVNDNLQPIKKLPINGKNTGRLTLGYAEFSLAEVRAIKTSQQASVNDVMLTVLGRAVEKYSRKHNGNPNQDFLRVLVPVNMRAEKEEGQMGNRISVLPVDLPFGVEKPLEHLRLISERSRVMKQSSLSNGLDMVLTLPSLTPAITQPLIWSAAPAAFALLAHTWCTNVAGPQIPMYVMGHELLHSYGYFPLNPSMGVACVVMSYNQKITMTIIADSGIVPDVMEIKEALESSYVALRKAAKVKEIDPISIQHPARLPDKSQKTESKKAAASEQAKTSVEKPAESKPETPEPTGTSTEEKPVEAKTTGNGTEKRAQSVEAATKKAETGSTKKSKATTKASKTKEEPVAEENKETYETPEDETLQESLAASAKTDVKVRPRLFSDEWAELYQQNINASQEYYNASKKWQEGPLAFVIKAAPEEGMAQDTAVILDLHEGKCRNARRATADEAMTEASYVLEGDYRSWVKVLQGEAQPLPMIMRGKLRLTRGSMTGLMPYTKSAQELVNCAPGIS